MPKSNYKKRRRAERREQARRSVQWRKRIHVDKFATYVEARERFDSWAAIPPELKRIRARANGTFEVIQYQRIREESAAA